MTILEQISQQQAYRVTAINENFEAVAAAGVYGINRSASVGLVFAYYGGTILVDGAFSSIADGTVALTGSATNYIERTRAGAVTKNTTGFTAGLIPVATCVTSASGITTYTDYRDFGRAVGAVELPVAGGSKRFITHPALTSLTDGTDTTPVNGTRYSCSIFIPHSLTLTGIAYLIGTVGGTDKVIAELKNAAGVNLATSALAGATVGTLATFQQVAFTATYSVLGPAWYFLTLQFNGTTARFRTIPANLGISQVALTQSVAGTFGTTANITAPTTFTAGVGPIAFTY